MKILYFTATRHRLEIGNRNGIEFSYINEIVMIDNYLPRFDINKELEKEPKKKIEENLEKIHKDIQGEKKYIKKHSFITDGLRVLIEKLSYDDQFEKNFTVENTCTMLWHEGFY